MFVCNPFIIYKACLRGAMFNFDKHETNKLIGAKPKNASLYWKC